MISAIIFDCFGVLAEDGWTPFKRQYIAPHPEIAKQVSELGRQVDAGERSYDDMICGTAELLGVTEQQVRDAVEHNVPNKELFAYIQSDLKPKYKIGMLSNASYNVLDLLFTKEQVALFDATAISYELGLTKPDPKMYDVIAERLGVGKANSLVIDDKPKHVEGAKAAGMQTLQYVSVEQLQADLEKVLQ